jgi:F-type H+-transporting ATPase subunit epsilon
MEKRKRFRLELITQEKELIKDNVKFAVVPSGVGPIGILPGHAPLIGTFDVGIVKAMGVAEKEFSVFVSNGFFMIYTRGVTIIAQNAELTDQIDIERAIAAQQRAEKNIGSKDQSIDVERAKNALVRAKTRIKAAEAIQH